MIGFEGSLSNAPVKVKQWENYHRNVMQTLKGLVMLVAEKNPYIYITLRYSNDMHKKDTLEEIKMIREVVIAAKEDLRKRQENEK